MLIVEWSKPTCNADQRRMTGYISNGQSSVGIVPRWMPRLVEHRNEANDQRQGQRATRYGHPAGISVLAVDGPLLLTRPVETGSSDRVANMRAFTRAALELLLEAVTKAG